MSTYGCQHRECFGFDDINMLILGANHETVETVFVSGALVQFLHARDTTL